MCRSVDLWAIVCPATSRSRRLAACRSGPLGDADGPRRFGLQSGLSLRLDLSLNLLLHICLQPLLHLSLNLLLQSRLVSAVAGGLCRAANLIGYARRNLRLQGRWVKDQQRCGQKCDSLRSEKHINSFFSSCEASFSRWYESEAVMVSDFEELFETTDRRRPNRRAIVAVDILVANRRLVGAAKPFDGATGTCTGAVCTISGFM